MCRINVHILDTTLLLLPLSVSVQARFLSTAYNSPEVSIYSYSALAAKTMPIMQLALQDHQNSVRMRLSLSDSMRMYAAP